MTIWVTTNGRPSNGAAELCKEQGFRRLRKGRVANPGDTVINWGSSQHFQVPLHSSLVNASDMVAIAANKLGTFEVLSNNGVQTVEWTANQAIAQSWANNDCTVVVRQKLTGHSGDGILIVEPHGQVPAAPLYTKYVFKEKEFRVHVVLGNAIDTQRKIKDPAREVKTWKVRSHDNGFIYVREGISPDAARDTLAVAAVGALALDFGAVDIIQDKKGKYYVLEVNTAPGITGQTVTNYAKAFRDGVAKG